MMKKWRKVKKGSAVKQGAKLSTGATELDALYKAQAG
jgi:hypothetical protein